MAQAPPPYSFNNLTAPLLKKPPVNNKQVSKSNFFSLVNPKPSPQAPISLTGKNLYSNFNGNSKGGFGFVPNITSNSTNTSDQQDYSTRKTALEGGSWTYKVSLVGNMKSNRYTKTFSGHTINSNIPSSQDYVTFDVMPNLSESGQVNLMNLSDIRSIASFIFWTGTASRMFSIQAKLISRTQEEADANYQRLFKLKSWRMPVSEAEIGAGTTPEVLMLFAYGQNINGVPVAVQSVTVNYNDETDQILTSNGNPMAIILPVNVELVEVRNMRDFKSFNYDSFRQGTLPRW